MGCLDLFKEVTEIFGQRRSDLEATGFLAVFRL